MGTTSDRTESGRPAIMQLLAVGLWTAVVIGSGLLLPAQWAAPLVRYGGVPAMGLLLMWVLVAVVCAMRTTPWRQVLVQHRRGFMLCGTMVVVLSGWVHLREPHGFKVIMDEPIMMATSMHMHLEHTTATMLRGLWVENEFVITNDMLDKRPLLFPFLVSLIHGLTGLRAANGIVLNAVLTPVLLAMVYAILRRWTEPKLALAGVLLFLSAGVVGQNLTGSGFEILNLCIHAGVGLSLWAFVRRPDRIGGALLLSLCALLVNVRYESAILVLPALAIFALVAWRTPTLLQLRSVFVAPLALLPLLLVMRVFEERPDVWQLEELHGATAPFSLGYVFSNVGHAMQFLFAADGRFGNSIVLSALGIVGVVAVLVRLPKLVRSVWMSLDPEASLALWGMGGVLHALFVMAYAWGRFDDVSAARLALPLLFSFALLGGKFLADVSGHRARASAIANGALAVAVASLVILHGASASRGEYRTANAAATTANWINSIAHQVNPRRTLVVDDMYRHVWGLNRVGITIPQVLADRSDQFRFTVEHGVYDAIFFVQPLIAIDEDGTWGTSPWYDIGGWADVEVVDELKLTPGIATRVVRLRSVNWEAFAQWRERVRGLPLRPVLPSEPMLRFKDRVIENLL